MPPLQSCIWYVKVPPWYVVRTFANGANKYALEIGNALIGPNSDPNEQ